MAYRPMVNEQWTLLTNKQMTKPGKMPADNFASDKLKLTRFDRHIAFLRPNVFVIYDDLEAEENNDWSLLLHSYKESFKANENQLILDQPDIFAQASLFSSQQAEMTVTDQFYEKPIDFKRKYASIPNQYHMTYQSVNKSKKMRFLTFIQVHDSKASQLTIEKNSDGQFEIGNWTIKAELDTNKTAALFAGNNSAQLHVNNIPDSALGKGKDKIISTTSSSASVLTEFINGKVHYGISTDQAPATN